MATLYHVIRISFELMQWLIIGRVLMSWMNIGPNNRIAIFMYEITEPIIAPIRKVIHRGSSPLDWSPLVAILLLRLVESFLLNILF